MAYLAQAMNRNVSAGASRVAKYAEASWLDSSGGRGGIGADKTHRDTAGDSCSSHMDMHYQHSRPRHR